jgi:hypothetical protein
MRKGTRREGYLLSFCHLGWTKLRFFASTKTGQDHAKTGTRREFGGKRRRMILKIKRQDMVKSVRSTRARRRHGRRAERILSNLAFFSFSLNFDQFPALLIEFHRVFYAHI